jgi:hypothetical protein
MTTRGATTLVATLAPMDIPKDIGLGVVDDVGEAVGDKVDRDSSELGNAWTPRVGKGAFELKGLPGNDVGQLGAGGGFKSPAMLQSHEYDSAQP